MQQTIFQHTTITDIETRIGRVLPGHGTGVGERAANNDIYQDEPYKNENCQDVSCPDEISRLQIMFSVLGNVIGGTILLYGLLALPHLIARFFSQV